MHRIFLIEAITVFHNAKEIPVLKFENLFSGKFSVVKEAISKKNGAKYAAKIIKFDADSLKFAIREYDIMTSGKMGHSQLVQLHEAYLVRKYLILIMDL